MDPDDVDAAACESNTGYQRPSDRDRYADAQHGRDDAGFIVRVPKRLIPATGRLEQLNADTEGEKRSREVFPARGGHERILTCAR